LVLLSYTFLWRGKQQAIEEHPGHRAQMTYSFMMPVIYAAYHMATPEVEWKSLAALTNKQGIR